MPAAPPLPIFTVPVPPNRPNSTVDAPLATVTSPSLMIFSVPFPQSPKPKALLLFQLEPAPSTVTVPVAPDRRPTEPNVLLTEPPLRILSVPLPELPTNMPALMFVNLEPAPFTVTVPLLPALSPIEVLKKESALSTSPPLVIVRMPSPEAPTSKLALEPASCQLEPIPSTVTAPLLPALPPITLL